MKKVLLGTPVHEVKDYSMERWLASVATLNYPVDLLLVDNSENPGYVKKLEQYCQKYKIPRFKIIHIDVPKDTHLEKRLGEAREAIRREVLKGGYGFWYSLECDVIVPPDTLTKLLKLISDYWMVSLGYPSRINPDNVSVELGTALIKREALEKLEFKGQYGFINPQAPRIFQGNESWFKARILELGGKYLNLFGVIKPIYHLVK